MHVKARKRKSNKMKKGPLITWKKECITKEKVEIRGLIVGIHN